MTFHRIYVDMDGVLCDLVKAILTEHGRMDLYNRMPHRKVTESIDWDRHETWLPTLVDGPTFWATLDRYPWTDEIMQFARDAGADVHVLTRPLNLSLHDATDIGYCVHGKMAWLRRQFGADFKDVVFTAEKHLLSQPGVLLIDDDEQYIERFEAAGGRQIIFPQSYNKFRERLGDRMAAVREQYDHLRGHDEDCDLRSRPVRQGRGVPVAS